MTHKTKLWALRPASSLGRRLVLAAAISTVVSTLVLALILYTQSAFLMGFIPTLGHVGLAVVYFFIFFQRAAD